MRKHLKPNAFKCARKFKAINYIETIHSTQKMRQVYSPRISSRLIHIRTFLFQSVWKFMSGNLKRNNNHKKTDRQT